ncbi:MAG TPA: DUF4340 domain-containing protein [Burkholderiales bacterium]|nr:DUF4340 domain-containing protein [Burkholderiales bacterium]
MATPARLSAFATAMSPMRIGWIVNLLLLVGVVGLAAYALWGRKAEDPPGHAIAAIKAAEIKRVVIEPREGKGMILEKQGEDWFVAQPLQARADRGQVERLLDLLSAKSRERLTAADLQRFELDTPDLKVSFDGHSVAFGTTNPLSQDQYVLSGDGVYLLPAYYRSLVPESPERVLTHALFRGDEKPVGFALGRFRVEQRDAKWTLSPAPADAQNRPTADDLNRWVDEWRLASSLLTQPATRKPAAETIPVETIEVRLADGRTLRLGVRQREPELVLVRADENLSFHFSGEMARRLLNPPAATPAPDAGAASAAQPQ